MVAFRHAGVLLWTRTTHPGAAIERALETAACFRGAESEVSVGGIGGIARAAIDHGIRWCEVDAPIVAGRARVRVAGDIGSAHPEAVAPLTQSRVDLGAGTGSPVCAVQGAFEGATRLAGGKFEARTGGGGQAGRTAGDGSIRRRGVHSATGYQPVVACR